VGNQAKPNPETAGRYEILLSGILGGEWSEWFDGMVVLPDEDGNTILVGSIADQSALHGILDRIRDLGLTLLSIKKVD